MKKLKIAITLIGLVMLLQSCSKAPGDNDNKNQNSKSQDQMKTQQQATTALMHRFNNAFQERNPAALKDLIAEDCVMESIEGPDGVRYEGFDACMKFWSELATNTETHFDLEEIFVAGDRATIRWRFTWGEGPNNSVRGVNLMRVRDNKIVEALGYSKTTAVTVVNR